MKRIVWTAVLFFVILFLCSRKSDAVRATERVIDRIGEVPTQSGADISKAEMCYSALSRDERFQVGNYYKLKDAKERYASFFETKDITLENWEDFLEVVEEIEWYEETRIGHRGFLIHTSLRAKEDFTVHDVSISMQITPQIYYCEFDFEKETYHLALVEERNLPETATTMEKRVLVFEPINHQEFYYGDKNDIDENGMIQCRDGRSAYIIYEYEIIDVNGAITYVK